MTPQQKPVRNTYFKRLFEVIKSWNYLRKWMVLGALIGVVAGIGAIAFIYALEGATKLLLEGIGGYSPPLPVGEGNSPGDPGFARPWAIPLVVGLGGLISGVLVFRFAPEAEGHGTDAAIAAVHHNPRGIRVRATVVKLVASAATIGSGGSAGREGPTAQISAGFGSLLARRLELTPEDARIAVAVGVGSGIGAIFRAPLGGAVLGTEVLYREDLEPEALMPSIIASVVGFSIFGSVEGFTPIFGVLEAHHFDHPLQLFYYALLGLVAGLMGRLYARSFYGTVRLTHRLPGHVMIKPAVAGILVGLIGLAFPAALGTGYGLLQEGMNTGLPDEALWFILALPLVKILATSLSIGSGGSGGIFGPGMVIGGFVGLGLWRILEQAPDMPADPAPFMVVGMIACFGSVAHAMLGLILMVAEMTGSLALLPPAMIAIGVATLVVGSDTIYEAQLVSRADVPAHRARFGLPLLGSIPIEHAMAPFRLTLPSGSTVGEARAAIRERALPGAPLLDAEGRFLGAVDPDRLDGGEVVDEVADREYPTVTLGTRLDAALDTLVSSGVAWLPVTDAQSRVVGVVGMGEVITSYRQELWKNLQLFNQVSGATTLIQATVGESSTVAGCRIADVRWPPGSVVLSIDRASQLLFPDSTTVVSAGDVVSLVVPKDREETLKQMLAGAQT